MLEEPGPVPHAWLMREPVDMDDDELQLHKYRLESTYDQALEMGEDASLLRGLERAIAAADEVIADRGL